jgi:hypothetical protein
VADTIGDKGYHKTTTGWWKATGSVAITRDEQLANFISLTDAAKSIMSLFSK